MKDYLKKIIACQLTIIMALSASTSAAFAKKANSKIKLNKGKSYTLKLKGTTKKASASTGNKKNQWIVKGIKAGKANITVKVNKKKYTCKVTVTDKTLAKNKAAAKKVEELILALPSTANLTVDDESQLKAANAAYNKLTSK